MNRIIFLRFLQFCFKSTVNFLGVSYMFPYLVKGCEMFHLSFLSNLQEVIELVASKWLEPYALRGRYFLAANTKVPWVEDVVLRCVVFPCFSLKWNAENYGATVWNRETFWSFGCFPIILETWGLSSHFAAVSQDAGSRRVRMGGIDSEWHAACPIHFDSSTSTSSTFAGIHFAVSKLSQWIKSSISQCICFKQSKRDFWYAQYTISRTRFWDLARTRSFCCPERIDICGLCLWFEVWMAKLTEIQRFTCFRRFFKVWNLELNYSTQSVTGSLW